MCGCRSYQSDADEMVGYIGVSLRILRQGEILVRNGMEGRLVHHVHHGGNAGWVALGAAAVGAVVGGLIGAAAH